MICFMCKLLLSLMAPTLLSSVLLSSSSSPMKFLILNCWWDLSYFLYVFLHFWLICRSFLLHQWDIDQWNTFTEICRYENFTQVSENIWVLFWVETILFLKYGNDHNLEHLWLSAQQVSCYSFTIAAIGFCFEC